MEGSRIGPRRSGRCLTCRMRKVKCDEGRPTCNRCKAGLHACLGYDDTYIFVDRKQAKSHAKPQSQTISCASSNAAKLPSCPPSRLPSRISLCGFQTDIVTSFLMNRFLVGFLTETEKSPVPAAHPQPQPQPHDLLSVTSLFSNPDVSSSSYLSGLSLAQAVYGREHKLDDLVCRSAPRLYGQALGRLSGDLQLIADPARTDKARPYSILWGSLFLGFYEMVAASSGQYGWLKHSQGVSAVTYMLGPEAFQSRSAHLLFEISRSSIIIGAMEQRKRSFLEHPRWKTIPWEALEPGGRSFYSLAQDISADIPGLLEDADALALSTGPGDGTARDTLNGKVAVLTRRLDDLRRKWKLSSPDACWASPPDPDTSVSVSEEGGRLFDTVLHYANTDYATQVLFFDAVRLVLLALSAHIGYEPTPGPGQGHVDVGPRPDGPLVTPGPGVEARDYALEICRSVDWLARGRQQGSSLGAFVFLFPLLTARDHLGDLPRVSRWLTRILSQLSTARGIEMENIGDLGNRVGELSGGF